ncbi:MAG: hypothetical protein IPJ40_04490 [Saprospirales bacterium]|nr:hypothetical protein [Saprospirales bacterium]
MFTPERRKWIFRLLQWATVGVLLGRAYQHWFWDTPYRSLLWDESFMTPILERLFGISWTDYAGNVRIDQGIQVAMRIIGSVFGIGAVVAAFPRFFPPRVWKLWVGLSAWLGFLAFLYYKEQNYQFGQFIEYALQAATPLFLHIGATRGVKHILGPLDAGGYRPYFYGARAICDWVLPAAGAFHHDGHQCDAHSTRLGQPIVVDGRNTGCCGGPVGVADHSRTWVRAGLLHFLGFSYFGGTRMG